MKGKSIVLIIIVSLYLSGKIIAEERKTEKKTGLQMAIRMADSEITQFPDASTVDFDPAGRWNYTPGLIASAMIGLWQKTGETKHYNYAKSK